MSKTAIEVDNVSMKFNLSREKVDSLKDYIFKTIKREIQYNEFWALKNVSFSVEKGDRVGILGLNGAGKSTLLKVISGVFKPTEGHVDKHGNRHDAAGGLFTLGHRASPTDQAALDPEIPLVADGRPPCRDDGRL